MKPKKKERSGEKRKCKKEKKNVNKRENKKS